jgi:nucleoside-diphosphate-sugar epimerase
VTLPSLSGRRVLVTGGSGFIGGRLVGRLATECGARVRVLVRSYSSAARIARYAIEMVRGDVTVAEDVDRAAAGCDVLFHCAYGKDGDDRSRRRATVSGVDNVVAAARRHGASRVVHTSTVSVYGDLTARQLDETAPRRRTGDSYGDAKVDAENAALEAWRTHGVPVSVIQPTVVYGPFGFTFTVNPLQQLRTGRLILIDGGTGCCNAVYVDDVVSALILAAVRTEAVGEAFLISGPAPTTWREFYGSYEQMLGVPATVSMSAVQAHAHYRAARSGSPRLLSEALRLLGEPEIRRRLMSTPEGSWLARRAKSFLPARTRTLLRADRTGETAGRGLGGVPETIHPVRPARIKLFAAPTIVRIDKAARLLGYRPAFDLGAGMTRTRAWAQWANLLDAR